MDFGLSCWVILKINCLQNIDRELFEIIFLLSFWGALKAFFDLGDLYLAL